MAALTIGMPTYNDFDGVYFTVQALRFYHDLDDTELLVVDNYGCEHTKTFVEEWAKGRYILATDAVGTATAKNRIFLEANGEAVLCCDSHVLFDPGAIARLKAYYQQHPDTRDLLQGPIVYDDRQTLSTSFDPVWRGQMWGIWATDPRGVDPEGEPFEIWGQGMGVFSCRKSAWLGFNPAFRGFGGEEGYIHEKFRQAGARCLCLPWLRWNHRFGRPAGVPYSITVLDKCRNYIIGLTELGLELEPVRSHFSEWVSDEQFAALVEEGRALADAERSGSISPAAPALSSLSADITLAGGESNSVAVGTGLDAMDTGQAATGRRAIVCFVEDQPHLIQQLLALYLSWLETNSSDTDLVVIGPEAVLDRLPEEVVKIPQQPAADDPVWGGYRHINAVACLNGAGAKQLDDYSHLLRTDVDTFITPAWNQFYPTTFTVGTGAYANDEDVRQRIRALAAEYGMAHHGMTNIGATWYGPTAVVRRAAAFAEMLAKHLLTDHFGDDAGQWPGWYRGVAVRYAGEIAVNHCAPDAQHSELLDAPSTSAEPITRYPHIHCWHTDQLFSKHAFMAGKYTREDIQDRDMNIVNNYCLALSLLSLEEFDAITALAHNQSEQHQFIRAMSQSISSDAQRVFSQIHDENLWQASSVSGPGSTQDATILIREELESLFRNLDIRVLCDAPCGDAGWITMITSELDYYFGFDIVENIVSRNLTSSSRTNHFFRVADISKDVLPKADAILCRDCIGHLPSQMGIAAIRNFKQSNSTYLIATTFPTVTGYVEQQIGGWWPVNMTIAPYNLPEPMCYLRERAVDPNDPYNDKSLGVWRLADL